MKNLIRNTVFAATAALACYSCLESDLTDRAYLEQNTLSSPNDSVYSLAGILGGLQEIAASYVVLGELQADLMDVTTLADRFLQEINQHETPSQENPYTDVTPYYTVINNCNYAIARMDTVIKNYALLPDYAAIVKIRAWVYFQLAKNFRQVRYYTQPVLTVEDAQNIKKNAPLLSREEIIDLLIPQVQAVLNVPDPGYSFLSNKINVTHMVPEGYFLLGDLYLWKNDYAAAAYQYKMAMQGGKNANAEFWYICNDYWNIKYDGNSTRATSYSNMVGSAWWEMFSPSVDVYAGSNKTETMFSIYYDKEYGAVNQLYNLTLNSYQLKASDKAVANWKTQVTDDANASEQMLKIGDYRGYKLTGTGFMRSKIYNINEEFTVIEKYQGGDTVPTRVILQRAGLLALRYAEAINRMGKPSMALAAINWGLKPVVLRDSVNPDEVESGFIFDYNDIRYTTEIEGNMGVRGRVHLRPCEFPAGLATKEDSILYVEDVILQEAALETAWEGNRYSDLVRVALRRGDPDYLASRVAEKFLPQPESGLASTPTANADAVRNKLTTFDAFFLPFPEK